MPLTHYLDKGVTLGGEQPCLTMGETDLSYAEVQRISHRVGRALQHSGITPGDKVAVLSSNDLHAFASVFGISRAGAVWCPINPRNEAAENRYVLDAFDCSALLFHSNYAPMVEQIRRDCPKLRLLICIDQAMPYARSWHDWLADVSDEPLNVKPPVDVVMIAGTGGTTGAPKGVMLSDRNLETMSALTLMGYPFEGRPSYLALAPLTHAAGVLCLPIMALGGRIVIMPKPDLDEFLRLIEARHITHTFLPPTLIYMLLQNPRLTETDRSSLQCFWYGAAPISVARLEEALHKIGPMAQLFGQTEAPMMISMMRPQDHFHADGSVARERLSSAGRPGPLVQVATMDAEGQVLPRGQTGEIVVRGSLVMMGYYKDAAATAEASRHGWHHTGDIGYLDEDGYLFIVDRAKDMIITGGFNVYSVEVEQALMQHPDVQDSAVIGLPDEKWGERVVAVLQLHSGRTVDPAEIQSFVKARIGSVKSPKQVEIWTDLPRSKVGKVMKKDIRAEMLKKQVKS